LSALKYNGIPRGEAHMAIEERKEALAPEQRDSR